MNLENLITKVKTNWFNISACVSIFNSASFCLGAIYLCTSPNPKEYWLAITLGFSVSIMFYILALWLFKNKPNQINNINK